MLIAPVFIITLNFSRSRVLYKIQKVAAGPVHWRPEKFENVAIFLGLVLVSTLIRRKCPRQRSHRNLKTPALHFRTENILRTELSEVMTSRNHCVACLRGFSSTEHKSKMAAEMAGTAVAYNNNSHNNKTKQD